ncbi:MAG: Fic family protein, partial [Chlamydiae bacterium]|nr:Fic family protein [Chlamydiota bacterium]
PGGASLRELLSSPEIQCPRRSLQRRLALLVEHGRIVVVGVSRARKYALPEEKKSIEEYSIPLTSNSKHLQSLVEQPIQARTPVGYDRTFLDRYRPNVTSYLPKTICDKFLVLGGIDEERPAGTYAREIFNRILIDLSWNSSRLEGNTYSLLETERLLELDAAAAGKNLAETQMILNHKAAIEFLVDSADQVDINKQTVLNIHALLSDNLLADPKACGSLRSKIIGIAKSVYHPLAVPNVIKECFEQLLHTAQAIQNPFEQAFFLMVHLPYLQPFEDVNKRVSRLAANIPLIRHNLSPLSFADVPQKTYIEGLLAVYELNQIDLLRDVFIWAYERSCALYSATRQTLGDPDPFRLRYREVIFEAVSTVVKKEMNKTDAVSTIKSIAKQSVAERDQSQFIEKVEIELKGLHEGNIARYRLRLSEYELWKKKWV